MRGFSRFEAITALLGINLDDIVEQTMKEYEVEKKKQAQREAEQHVRDARAAEKNRLLQMSQRNHIPGTRHTLGTTNYVVMPNGSWLRMTKKPHEDKDVFLAHLDAARTKFPRAKVGV